MSLKKIRSEIILCRKCPRLTKWREKVAREKVRRFKNCEYWGKPVPGFGDPKAKLIIVGLAPAAHGGNRTGRMFTGDRSGDWLFHALYKFGFANQPTSADRKDGMKLKKCYITAVCRCAPPKNKLLPAEIKNCSKYLLEELKYFKNALVVIGLGKIGFDAACSNHHNIFKIQLDQKPKFGHGVEYNLNSSITLLGSYHPSQQNTFTGRLTKDMFEAVFHRARRIIDRI